MDRTIGIMHMAVLIALTLTFLTALAFSVVCGREREELTDKVRANASGMFIRLTDGLTHYELAGPANGKTIVLVHGLSTYCFTWDAAFQALVDAGFRVLRYDLFGRGYSDRPAIVYDKDLFDRQLCELLDALDIHDPAGLVGNSMGGLITTTFAARHPEKVGALALIDPAFFFLKRVPFPLAVPLVGDYAGRAFAVPFLAKAQTKDFKHPERFPDYDRTYRLQMRYKGFSRAIVSTIRSFPAWNAEEDFGQVAETAIPVLVIWGREDRTVPFDVSGRVREIAPHAEFYAIDEAAHLPHYELPEIVNPIIVRFLKAHKS